VTLGWSTTNSNQPAGIVVASRSAGFATGDCIVLLNYPNRSDVMARWFIARQRYLSSS